LSCHGEVEGEERPRQRINGVQRDRLPIKRSSTRRVSLGYGEVPRGGEKRRIRGGQGQSGLQRLACCLPVKIEIEQNIGADA
jgi:hypothetical protein